MSGPVYDRHGVAVHVGDCLTVLKEIADESVHAVVTDPPYGLADHKPAAVITALTAWANGDRASVPDGKGGFMGRKWDSFVPPPAVWDECLRVLKPGGHMLVFAGTRTVDLMGLSIRLAGFEIRDSVSWLYGSGFPKSLDVSKAIDKAAGAQREVVGPPPYSRGKAGQSYSDTRRVSYDYDVQPLTAPATDAARQWSGWGTALKPASEPVIWAQKPFKMVPLWEAAIAAHHSLGALLWLSLSPAKRAELSSPSSPHALPEGMCASALAAAALATSPGRSGATATFSSPARESMCWSIVSSWSAILAALSAPTSTSTTSMTSSTTTVLRTLNSLLAPLTSPNTMPRCACLLDGQPPLAPSVVASSNAEWSNWKRTLSASAHESAIEGIALAASNVLASVAAGLSSEPPGSTAQSSATTPNLDENSAHNGVSSAAPSSSLVDVLDGSAHERALGRRSGSSRSASEPIIVARKPLTGTVAANVQEHGTGGLNIEACRVATDEVITNHARGAASAISKGIYGNSSAQETHQTPGQHAGRWPTNVVLDEHAAAELDAQSGTLSSWMSKTDKAIATDEEVFGKRGPKPVGPQNQYGDVGGASRFFPTFRYEAKATTAERPSYLTHSCDCEAPWPAPSTSRARDTGGTTEPCDSNTSRSGSENTDDLSPTGTKSTTATKTSSTTDPRTCNSSTQSHTNDSTPDANCAMESGGSPAASVASSNPSTVGTGTSHGRGGRSTADAGPATLRVWLPTSVCGNCGAPSRRKRHETVKPLDLMRWLVRLVTPPGGGTVLDCFAGTGTTGHAARAEGMKAILIERDADHIPLIVSRLDGYRAPAEVDQTTGQSAPLDLLDLLDGEAS